MRDTNVINETLNEQVIYHFVLCYIYFCRFKRTRVLFIFRFSHIFYACLYVASRMITIGCNGELRLASEDTGYIIIIQVDRIEKYKKSTEKPSEASRNTWDNG